MPRCLDGPMARWPDSSKDPCAAERDVRVLPGFLEPRADGGGRLLLALGVECLGETEQRPAVFRVLFQVLPEDGLGLVGAAGLEEDGAQGLADWRVPVGGLLIDERVLVAHGAVVMQHGAVPVLALRSNLTGNQLGR